MYSVSVNYIEERKNIVIMAWVRLQASTRWNESPWNSAKWHCEWNYRAHERCDEDHKSFNYVVGRSKYIHALG